MATISFSSNDTGVATINALAGSGLGFFGSAFGTSVEVNAYQTTTWITDGNGVSQGPQCNNVKYVHPNSGSVNGAGEINIQKIPNYLSTLKISFTHTSAVAVQNAKLRIYDRSNYNNPASGVVTKVAEIIHPATSQVVTGSGDTSWLTPTGSSVVVDFTAGPGVSGEFPNGPGAGYTSTQHDWYAAISASPSSIGSKTLYGLYFETEYL